MSNHVHYSVLSKLLQEMVLVHSMLLFHERCWTTHSRSNALHGPWLDKTWSQLMLFVSQHARGSKKGLRAFASVAMSVRDMLVELQVCSIEIAAQLAVSHALLIKMQKVLQEVKDAVDPPAVVSKTSGSQAQDFQNFEKLGVDFDCLGKKGNMLLRQKRSESISGWRLFIRRGVTLRRCPWAQHGIPQSLLMMQWHCMGSLWRKRWQRQWSQLLWPHDFDLGWQRLWTIFCFCTGSWSDLGRHMENGAADVCQHTDLN